MTNSKELKAKLEELIQQHQELSEAYQRAEDSNNFYKIHELLKDMEILQARINIYIRWLDMALKSEEEDL